jgi:6-phosphofructokinase 1
VVIRLERSNQEDDIMRVGVLTGGGDCPGLNAVIRAVVRRGVQAYGFEFVGFRYGWRGVVESDIVPLDRHHVRGLSRQGGTILGSSRTNPFEGAGGGPENIQRMLDANGIDAIIAIGGEGTLTAARRLVDEGGIKVIGVPKTIDNDLAATDYSFGFDTAVEIATEAIDRLRTTAESHQRCMIVEVMGRHVGWIALHSGMAGGAHAILIPEQPQSIDQICEWVESVRTRGRAPVIVVSEGFHLDTMEGAHSHKGLDAFNRPRLGGIGELLAPIIEERTGIESRATVIGHIQRGGVPSAYDRVLATRLGMSAIDAVQNEQWGSMVSLRGTDVVNVSIADATVGLNTVPQYRYDEAALLFG